MAPALTFPEVGGGIEIHEGVLVELGPAVVWVVRALLVVGVGWWEWEWVWRRDVCDGLLAQFPPW